MVVVFMICAIQFLKFALLINQLYQLLHSPALWANVHTCVIG